MVAFKGLSREDMLFGRLSSFIGLLKVNSSTRSNKMNPGECVGEEILLL